MQAIRANDASMLTCGIDTGSVAAINASMGNIALLTGRKVHWDAAAGEFTGDAEANAMIKANYRAPYLLPKI